MKVGDKIYCKRGLYNSYGKLFFKKDNWYTIGEVRSSIFDTFDIVVLSERNDSVLFYTTTTNNNNEYKYWNYFYSMKELRKLKLKKINEKRQQINM